MIKLKKLIKESTWDRKFGEPLPTLDSVMEKHGDCGCGGTHACACDTIHESAKEVMKGKKLSQLIQKDESRLRLNMWELVGLMSIDNSNKKLADELSRSYKKNVTIFMRDMLSLVKKMK
jgi:hypothetical protein